MRPLRNLCVLCDTLFEQRSNAKGAEVAQSAEKRYLIRYLKTYTMAKDMIIEKTVSINKNINPIFDFLKETKNQDKFSVWNMKDPEMKKSYSGTDGTKGFVYSWDSKDKSVGAGSQEITNIIPGKEIDYLMKFLRPMQNSATASFKLNKLNDNSTSVSWTFQSPTKFPMSLFSPIFKSILGKQLQQSLDNLKALLEKN